jgi:hypothetical protein
MFGPPRFLFAVGQAFRPLRYRIESVHPAVAVGSPSNFDDD